MVTAETVVLTTLQINQALETAGTLLEQVRDGKHYQAMGYTKFGDYIEREIMTSSSTVYRLLNQHQMNRVLNSQTRELLNQSESQVLKRLEIEEVLIVPIVVMADRRAELEGRKRCARDIKTVGAVVKQMYDTGTVDPGNGFMSAVEKALTQEEYEIGMRQKQHVADSRREWQTLVTYVGSANSIAKHIPSGLTAQGEVIGYMSDWDGIENKSVRVIV